AGSPVRDRGGEASLAARAPTALERAIRPAVLGVANAEEGVRRRQQLGGIESFRRLPGTDPSVFRVRAGAAPVLHLALALVEHAHEDAERGLVVGRAEGDRQREAEAEGDAQLPEVRDDVE